MISTTRKIVITGGPGAGKSTLLASLARAYLFLNNCSAGFW
ncbi:AAA family ATPase, partial [Cronobacter sakazakii]|nr:AAA family ATPase [Cronobacter sakazakii]